MIRFLGVYFICIGVAKLAYTLYLRYKKKLD
uniref:Uncharacterized protein n=1 Tax=Myoviridae sp. ctNQr16 TaxID=2826644 RepID=A0A8S5MB81_9CAUD|nr:MAG TPA: hypothetical protein [Myoviridae sp. ctNQr16]DAY67092.1 MAG TPA: hypothetical protein [Caudoviricetes sp.]